MVITKKPCPYLDVAKAEKLYNATYVGMFCLKTQDGGWSEDEIAVFHQPHPVNPDHDPYFGLYYRGGRLYICSAMSTVDVPIIGAVAEDGEVIYSACRHDYTVSKDGTAFIDGGRDYVKTGMRKTVVLVVEDGELKICENPDALFLKVELSQ